MHGGGGVRGSEETYQLKRTSYIEMKAHERSSLNDNFVMTTSNPFEEIWGFF